MAIKEIAKGKWRVQVYTGKLTAAGTPARSVRIVLGGIRKAKDAERKLKNEREEGKLVTRRSDTVSDYLEHYILARAKNLVGDARPVGGRTLEGWCHIADGHVAAYMGSLPIQRLTARKVRAYLTWLEDEKHLRGTTRRKHYQLLSMALKQAVVDNVLTMDPCSGVRAPAEDTAEKPHLTADQAVDLLAKLRAEYEAYPARRAAAQAERGSQRGGLGVPGLAAYQVYVPLLVALDIGLRRGELLALRWQDVNLETRRVQVDEAVVELSSGSNRVSTKAPKTKRGQRAVYLLARDVAALKTHQRQQNERRMLYADRWQDNDLVFPAADRGRGREPGRIWPPSSFTRIFGKAMDGAGYEWVTTHTLRHTWITRMDQAGVRREVLSRAAGHSSSAVTDVYTHMDEGELREAADALERSTPAG